MEHIVAGGTVSKSEVSEPENLTSSPVREAICKSLRMRADRIASFRTKNDGKSVNAHRLGLY